MSVLPIIEDAMTDLLTDSPRTRRALGVFDTCSDRSTRPRARATPVVLFLGIVLAVLGACRGGTENPIAPTIEGPPVQPTTTFQGVIVGMNEIGSVDLTIDADVTPATRADQALQSSSRGTLRLAGAAPLPLAGTYEDVSREVLVSGSGFSLTGNITDDGSQLTGPYTGRRGTGGSFAMQDNAGGALTHYCGTFTGASGGRLALSISTTGLIVGLWLNAASGAGNLITGRRNGTTLILEGEPPMQGAQSGSVLSGTWGDATGNGTWETSEAACLETTPLPTGVVLWDNGASAGPQRNVRNEVGSQDVFEDIRLTRRVTLTGVRWQQHVHNQATYHHTEILIFAGLPHQGTRVFQGTFVATRTRNATGTLFDAWEGFDFAIEKLSIVLAPGTYWLGINNRETGITAGWDNTAGGADTIHGSRVITVNNPSPGSIEHDNFAFVLHGRVR